jgi:hypothetical protein
MRKLLQAALAALLLTAGIAIAAEIKTLDTTDASNTGSVMGLTNSTAPSAVDDRWRAFQGALGRYIADQASGLTVYSTSSTAYRVTGNDASTALLDGRLLIVEMTPTNKAVSPTLNVNDTGNKRLEKIRGTSLSANEIIEGSRILVSYDKTNDVWLVMAGLASSTAAGYSDPLTTRGDILTRGASETQRVAKGVSGYPVISNGTDTLFARVASPGIANKAIETSKIADGTDGELITWSPAGVASTVTAGTVGQLLRSNGSGAVPVFATISSGFTQAAKQASTSGSSINFTGIPSGVKMVIMNFDGVSVNGSAYWEARLGDSGGVESSGYVGTGARITTSTAAIGSATSGFYINNDAAANTMSGQFICTLTDADTFAWTCSWNVKLNTNIVSWGAGNKTLSAELDRISLTNGGVFDAGSISIIYQ